VFILRQKALYHAHDYLQSTSLSHGGFTFNTVLSGYYHAPLEHIMKYPSYIRTCMAHLPERAQSDRDRLQTALTKAERLTVDARLLAWQVTQGNDQKYRIAWNDLFLESEKPKISAKEVERQT